jgi:hypothetical protein
LFVFTNFCQVPLQRNLALLFRADPDLFFAPPA